MNDGDGKGHKAKQSHFSVQSYAALTQYKDRFVLCPWMGWKLTSGDMGLFTGPHHTSFSEPSSFTIRLSDGLRPLFAPLLVESAPEAVMAEPVS